MNKFPYAINVWVLLITVLSVACSGTQETKKTPDTVEVTIGHPLLVRTSFPISASGTLASRTELKLSFKTGGIINRITATEGEEVEPGELIASLNTSEIKAQAKQAHFALEKAQRDLQRAENLYADSVATLEQLQNARTAVEISQAQLEIAEFNLQYSSIVAPEKGVVMKTLAEPNEMIGPGQPIVLFSVSASAWVLRVNLADTDIVRISNGDEAQIRFDAFPDRVFKSEVIEIASISDPYTGTYEVELQIFNTPVEFRSGLIGKALIIPGKQVEYKALPVRAVHEAQISRAYVYLAHGNRFEKKDVDILAMTDSLIYINGSLSPADSVILDGASFLVPGSIIRITE